MGDYKEIKEDGEIYTALDEIRTKIDCVDELVGLLDDKPEGIEVNRYRDFCKLYVIILFQTYNDTRRAEFLLAMCGLLNEFDSANDKTSGIGKREKKYWEYYWGEIPKENPLWNGRYIGETSANTSLREKYKEIIGELEKKLSEQKSKNNGKLGLTTSVLRYFNETDIFDTETGALILPKFPLQPLKEEPMSHQQPQIKVAKQSITFEIIQQAKGIISAASHFLEKNLIIIIIICFIAILCSLWDIKVRTTRVNVAKIPKVLVNIKDFSCNDLHEIGVFIATTTSSITVTEDFTRSNYFFDNTPEIFKGILNNGPGEFKGRLTMEEDEKGRRIIYDSDPNRITDAIEKPD